MGAEEWKASSIAKQLFLQHIRHCLRPSVAVVRQTAVLTDSPAGRMAWTARLLSEHAALLDVADVDGDDTV